MTKEEYQLVYGEVLELKLSVLENNLSNKLDNVLISTRKTTKALDTHLSWHRNLVSDIAKTAIKYSLMCIFIGILVAFVVGIQNGFVPTALAKVGWISKGSQ